MVHSWTILKLTPQTPQTPETPYTIFINTTHTMKWTIWVHPNQTFDEFYPDGWSHDDVERAANNRYGGKVTAVHPAPVGAEPRARRSSGGGGGSASEPGGCGGVLLLIIGAIAIGALAGGDDTKRPSTPPESLSQPQSRVAEPYTPPAPEPQFKDYESPPPSYCVTENFEPC